MTSLDDLPHEIILIIGQELIKKRKFGSDVCCFIRTSTRYAEILIPSLYATALLPTTKKIDRACPEKGYVLVSRPPHRIWKCALHWQSRYLLGYLSSLTLEWITTVKFHVEKSRATFETMIMKFIRSGSLSLVQNLLGRGVSPNIGAPLLIATQCGHLQICKLLVDAGADVLARLEKKGEPADTPLCVAVAHSERSQWEEIAFYLIEIIRSGEKNIDSPGYKNRTALYYAVWSSSTELVRLLLDCGADVFSVPNPDSLDFSGSNPFYQATKNRAKEICMLLVDRMAAVNLDQFLQNQDENGNSPLHAALAFQMWDLSLRLIGLGFDISQAKNADGETAIQLAVRHSAPQNVLDVLLAQGPEVWGEPGDLVFQEIYSYHVEHLNAPSLVVMKKLHDDHKITLDPNAPFYGGNALNVICETVKSKGPTSTLTPMIKLLLDLGASPNLQNDTLKWTPLLALFSREHAGPLPEIVALLIDHMSDSALTVQNDCNETCLHLAVSQGNRAAVMLLLNRLDRKTVLLPNLNGNTVLNELGYSMKRGHPEKIDIKIIRLLVQHCPELLNARDNYGNTPVHLFTLWSDRIDHLAVLHDAGADFGALNSYLEPPFHNTSSTRTPHFIRFFLDIGANTHPHCKACAADLKNFKDVQLRERIAMMGVDINSELGTHTMPLSVSFNPFHKP